MATQISGDTGVSAVQPGVVAQGDLAANVVGNGPAFSAYQSSLQNITSGSFQKVLFQAEEVGGDTNANYDVSASLFTPTVAGWYQLNGTVQKADTGAIIVSIFKNGAEHRRGVQLPGSNVGSVSSLVYMNGSTDFVEIKANTGTTVNTVAGVSSTFFNGFLARAA